MQDAREEVWEEITASAMEKVGTHALVAELLEWDQTLAENILFAIIARTASQQSLTEIIRFVNSSLLLLGLVIDNEALSRFIREATEKLELEILVTYRALSMLEEETPGLQVLEKVRSLLVRGKIRRERDRKRAEENAKKLQSV